MSRASIDQSLPAGERILLDTTTIIAYLDGGEPVSPVATYIFDSLVESGRNEAVVSMITVMELLVKPLRHGPGTRYHHAMDFLTRFPHLHAAPVDLPVAQESASLRATYNFRPPDALIIATGIVAQVGHLVSNDAEWQRKLQPIPRRIKVCYLRNHLPVS